MTVCGSSVKRHTEIEAGVVVSKCTVCYRAGAC